ncbi:zinc ribbon domain-containing protein [Dickeya fangzhongdai]|uniref:zinc ribbon domain-containing protein n=1 Tax=Dickeya fangzhongdai TaxID=1778540 RepID=UPI001ADC9716|nr:zinc ribbon domain-containing protein [Dickeya fangzhongdai]MBO8136230.1 zinc ribbon domain-containing protein [Dickeya fangzhongdai]
MDAYCPECQQPMVWRGNEQYRCEACQRYLLRLALCPQCEQPLQVLRACGTESYLCADGHGLISRSRVVIRYQPKSLSQ